MTLTDILHDRFVSCGEILPASEVATIIQEYELDNILQISDGECLSAYRDAGERFVDSMQNNEHDTLAEKAQTEDDCAKNCGRWERMRPSKSRRFQIQLAIR